MLHYFVSKCTEIAETAKRGFMESFQWRSEGGVLGVITPIPHRISEVITPSPRISGVITPPRSCGKLPSVWSLPFKLDDCLLL